MDLRALLASAQAQADWCRETGLLPPRCADWPGTVAAVAQRALDLEAERDRLRADLLCAAGRIAAASEVLGKAAERSTEDKRTMELLAVQAECEAWLAEHKGDRP